MREPLPGLEILEVLDNLEVLEALEILENLENLILRRCSGQAAIKIFCQKISKINYEIF